MRGDIYNAVWGSNPYDLLWLAAQSEGYGVFCHDGPFPFHAQLISPYNVNWTLSS